MNMQCRKCGEDSLVVNRPVFYVRIGWYFSLVFPFLHYGIHEVRSGFLVQCTRHGCGRGWVATERGMADPGVGEPRIVSPTRLPERDEDEREPPEFGVIGRAEV